MRVLVDICDRGNRGAKINNGKVVGKQWQIIDFIDFFRLGGASLSSALKAEKSTGIEIVGRVYVQDVR